MNKREIRALVEDAKLCSRQNESGSKQARIGRMDPENLDLFYTAYDTITSPLRQRLNSLSADDLTIFSSLCYVQRDEDKSWAEAMLDARAGVNPDKEDHVNYLVGFCRIIATLLDPGTRAQREITIRFQD